MSQVIFGGYGGGVPPLPIPNREVKPARADGTAPCGRVGRRLFSFIDGFSSAIPEGDRRRKFFCIPSVSCRFGWGIAFRRSGEGKRERMPFRIKFRRYSMLMPWHTGICPRIWLAVWDILLKIFVFSIIISVTFIIRPETGNFKEKIQLSCRTHVYLLSAKKNMNVWFYPIGYEYIHQIRFESVKRGECFCWRMSWRYFRLCFSRIS